MAGIMSTQRYRRKVILVNQSYMSSICSIFIQEIDNTPRKRPINITGFKEQILIYKSFFLEVLKLLAFQGIWMFLCSQFPLFFPLPGKNKGKSYCTLSSSFAASRLASLLACA